MGVRYRSATPGTLLCLAATILLVIVSFNTPLLKSLYFLSASYSSGQYAGTLKLGTLGYCLDENGSETCVGPTVGYEFSESSRSGVDKTRWLAMLCVLLCCWIESEVSFVLTLQIRTISSV
jgi:hypothetical protein